MALCARIATYCVRYASWMLARAGETKGRKPSRPRAYRARGVASVMPITLPNIDRTAAAAMTPAPNGPAIRAAAADSGAEVAAASADTPRTRWATSCTAMYSSIAVSIASASARGTVRAGSRTSPLGTNALSDPANAKMRTSTVPPRSPPVAPGDSGAAAPATTAPAMTKRNSGSSLITAINSTNRAPPRTPRMLIAVTTPMTITRNVARGTGWASNGQSTAADPASALETADTANTAITQSNTPLRNPANGPNASVT